MLKKYPFVKQVDEKECGVACLQMIINYHKGNVPLARLSEMTKTNKEGTSAYHLFQAAKELGMETKGIKIPFSEWTKELLILPCIVPVLLHQVYEHYIVLYAVNFKKKKIIIGDPSDNIKVYSFLEFEKIYRSTLLFLYPITNLPVYTEPSFFLNIVQLLRPHWKVILKIIILSLFITILSLIGSYHLKELIELIELKEQSFFFILCLIFLSIFFLKIILEFFRNLLISKFHNTLDKILTPDILQSILSLPYSYYRLKTTGDFISRIQDLSVIRSSVINCIVTILVDGLLSLGACILIFQINHTLFLLLLILLIFLLLGYHCFHPILERLIRRSKEEKSRNTTVMIESITGFETLKGLNLVPSFLETFRYKHSLYVNHSFTMDKLYYSYLLLKDVLCQVGYLVLLFFAAYLTLENKISIGSFLSFQAILSYVLNPIQEILDSNLSFKDAKLSYLRVLGLNVEQENKETFSCSSVNSLNLHHLTYPKEEPILRDINCRFQSGEKVLLIGPSGSGKSTLLKLLKGYEKVERGMYQIDNIDFCDLNSSTVQDKINYLSQNEILFTDTIYHNLLLNRETSLEKLNEVNHICELEPILRKKTMGYHTLLEENGFNVSGGEKDRIVLARTLLNHNRIILIDEGFSQVDSNMERRILKNIFETHKNSLVIIVSHRLDNMDLFERVIHMKQGKIVTDTRKHEE